MKTDEIERAELLAKAVPASRPVAADQAALTSGETITLSVFDGDSLLQRLLGDRELACEVLAGFVQDAPFQLMQLHARLVEEDTAKVQLQAHNLKGAAATVGAEALRAIALSIETSAAASQLDPCRHLLPLAINEFERFRAQVVSEGWIAKTNSNFQS